VRRCTQGLLPFLARLACVKRAASVDSEPGSNSRLILCLSPSPAPLLCLRSHSVLEENVLTYRSGLLLKKSDVLINYFFVLRFASNQIVNHLRPQAPQCGIAPAKQNPGPASNAV
jgi:hypothetical protein